ncbi:hypothetical protein [Methylobacterium oxalidis]|uniref:N-acetyltransferase domain-containing protein n=1 Tax=Methylobacterium oxalidis TaxID=944322 RepID=A0A512JC51_9HYPH|nr:hypothetical protein [Methylobacterium oxalidis]GEP07530.1 hypothetical protein MOX02_55680 [Methylobacterium oxalidis]GJE35614.1 hypothetical protein LDDCCGHA_5833 [Methylobacterium oxalidis]GLS65764.1 hypothetical protein GCM10007888_41460 [Methylobacterium oxalidis]
MQHFMRRATYEDARAVSQLRQAAYKSSPDFTLCNTDLLDKLAWSREDERADVLGIWSEGMLVATMRCDVIADHAHALVQFDGMPVPADRDVWPSPILTRGATVRSRAGGGLNSLMRLRFVEASMNSGYQRLYGYVVMGGARTHLMQALGYEFLPREDADPEWASPSHWAMAWIDLRARGAAAVAHLKAVCSNEEAQHPWVGPKFTRLAGSIHASTPP